MKSAQKAAPPRLCLTYSEIEGQNTEDPTLGKSPGLGLYCLSGKILPFYLGFHESIITGHAVPSLPTVFSTEAKRKNFLF